MVLLLQREMKRQSSHNKFPKMTVIHRIPPTATRTSKVLFEAYGYFCFHNPSNYFNSGDLLVLEIKYSGATSFTSERVNLSLKILTN